MGSHRDAVIGVLGIVAAFVATYFGVYLGIDAQLDQKRKDDHEAYLSLLSVMSKDCHESLRLAKESISAIDDGFVPQPGLLISALYENSLLAEQMAPADVERLAEPFAKAANNSSKVLRKYNKYDQVAMAAERTDMPQPIQDDIDEFKNKTKKELEIAIKDCANSVEGVCNILDQARCAAAKSR